MDAAAITKGLFMTHSPFAREPSGCLAHALRLLPGVWPKQEPCQTQGEGIEVVCGPAVNEPDACPILIDRGVVFCPTFSRDCGGCSLASAGGRLADRVDL